MSVTYVSEGDRATPGNMNTWLNQAGGGLVNVKSYGALGDGSTDNRAALATADALGETLFFPKGTYRISSNITFASRIYFDAEAKVSVDSGVTATFSGLLDVSENTNPFEGAGTVALSTVDLVVGTDATTVQKTVDLIPKTYIQQIRVLLPDGTYNEDVRVDGFHAQRMRGSTASPSTQGALLIIEGQSQTSRDPDVRLRSIAFSGCTGNFGNPTLRNLTVFGASPFETDEDAAVIFWGCPQGEVNHVSFDGDGVTRCVMAYRSIISSYGCDFGTSVNQVAYWVKHGGEIWLNTQGPSDANTGHLTLHGYAISMGSIQGSWLDDLTSDSILVYDGRFGSGQVGFVTDGREGVLHNVALIEPMATRVQESFTGGIEGYHKTITSSATILTPTSTPSITAGVHLQTGATAGSEARLTLKRLWPLHGKSWDRQRDFAVSFLAVNTSSMTAYAVTGDLDGKYVGYKIAGGNLYGVAHDGVQESTTTLKASLAANEVVRSYCHIRSDRSDARSRVEFLDFGNQPLSALTSSLPADSVSTSLIDFKVSNTTSSDAQLRLYEYYMGQRSGLLSL